MIIPMKGIEIAFLAVGGLFGTFLRYGITKSPLILGALPVNVLIVNVIGSFILGAFAVLSPQWNLDQKYTLLAAIGFCGSFTTMSSFALESSNMIDNKQYSMIALNVITNVGLSLGAIFGGKALVTAIVSEGLK
ncbi:fluoride efflux transporter FluC [Candidatus Nitrosotalea bavarica]|uniref:fluoride efflux transporter FluC n=1 Tax=Candidatus Nitrosotalea bavarica TaxID=1903277 RepID=UPI001FE959A8|nr:CrcB family protein [Candidatus Nitrosotalea bavarica]